MTGEEIFGKIWDILAKHAGVRDDVRTEFPRGREGFIKAFSQSRPGQFAVITFRLPANPGGLSFHRYEGIGYTISYRTEDLTTDAIKKKVVPMLQRLPFYMPPTLKSEIALALQEESHE